MKTTNTDEKKQTAASYIITFYEYVISINSYYASYVNTLLELSKQYDIDSIDEIETNHRQILLNSVQNMRLVIQSIYIAYKTINSQVKSNIDKEEVETFENNFKHCIDTFIPEKEKVLEFVLFVNKFLVQDIMKDLLQDSQDIMNQIYT